MPYDAFISYRHADADAARAVTKLLRAFEQSVFIDDGIAVGAEWAPEIWSALRVSKKLIVLWSRSAAKSEFVHSEWSRAPAECKVLALQLDGEALPSTLGKFNAITGLDVAGRLLARSVELMKRQKLSPAKAQEQLLRELAQDGIVLEEKQKRALAAFLPVIAGTSWGLSVSLPTLTLFSGGLGIAFAVGYWVAPGKVMAANEPPAKVDLRPALPAESATSNASPCKGSSAPAEAGAATASPAELLTFRSCQTKLARCEQTVDTDKANETALRDQITKLTPIPPDSKTQQRVVARPINSAASMVLIKPRATTAAGGAAPLP